MSSLSDHRPDMTSLGRIDTRCGLVVRP